MTKEEFEVLQLDLQHSGKSVKDYLQESGVNYSTYNYWRKKLLAGAMPSGATLLFPNGLRAHFGSGTESVLMELLTKSLVAHVLPE